MEEQRKEFAHETLHHTAEVTIKNEVNVDFLLNHSKNLRAKRAFNYVNFQMKYK